MRERTNRLYSVWTYYLTKWVMDLPHLFCGNTLLCVIIYYSVRLNDSYAYKFFVFCGLANYLGFTGSAYGYFVGTLGKTTEQLTVLNPVRGF